MSLNTSFSISPFFTPLQIPGCEYWFDATDGSTIARSGTSLTSWTNKGTAGGSITVNAGTATTGTTQQNALNLIVLPAGTELIFTGSFPNPARTRFFASKPTVNTTTTSVNFLWQNKTTLNGNDSCGIESSALVEVAQGQIVNLTSATISNQQNTFSVYTFANATSSAANNRLALNGSALALPTNLTASQYNTASATNYINASIGNVSAQQLGEWISYNSELTLQQIQQVEAYLAWKWGVVENLPNTNPYKTFYRVVAQPTRQLALSQSQFAFLRPTSLGQCVLWLDAADQNTIRTSGTDLTGWTDKSGGTLNNSFVVSSPAPTYSAVSKAVVFSGTNGNFIKGRFNTTYSSNASVFVVGSYTTYPSKVLPRILILATNLGTDTALIGQLNLVADTTNPNLATYVGNGENPTQLAANIQTYIPTSYSTQFIFENLSSYDTGTTQFTNDTFLNGNTSLYSSSSITATKSQDAYYRASYDKYVIGAYPNATTPTGEFYNGTISEVVVFSKVLTTGERQQVEGYLAWKWGLQGSLPNNHPFKAFPPGLNINPSIVTLSFYNKTFQPTSITGSQLWLDAADPSTFSLSGTSVVQWNDKSGLNNHATQSSSGNRPTYSVNNRRVNFVNSSSQYFNLPNNTLPTGNNSYAYFIVCSFASAVDGLGVIGGGNYGTDSQVFAVRSFTTNRRIHQYWWNNDLSSDINAYTVDVALLIECTYTSGGTRATLTNGTQLVSDTPAARNQGAGNNTVGATYVANSEFLNGFIQEVIVYNASLSVSQRQRVEGYLAWKWGLQGNLPANHPFKNFPPPPV